MGGTNSELVDVKSTEGYITMSFGLCVYCMEAGKNGSEFISQGIPYPEIQKTNKFCLTCRNTLGNRDKTTTAIIPMGRYLLLLPFCDEKCRDSYEVTGYIGNLHYGRGE